MKIQELNISEYTAAFPYDMGQIVFQIMGYEGEQFEVHYPMPERGRDAEIDFEDGQFPVILFAAMLGKKIDDPESFIGKFFSVELPDGVLNG